MYTLSEIKTIVAPFVLSGGSCPNTQTVVDRVNEAVSRLLVKGDWVNTIKAVDFYTENNSITLPREFKSARMVTIDGWPQEIFSPGYNYSESGPGMCVDWYTAKDLVAMPGRYPVFFDVPTCEDNVQLVAFTTENMDVGKEILIQGRRSDKSWIQTNGVPGESLKISKWAEEGTVEYSAMNLSENYFWNVESIKLPAGRTAYVTLYARVPGNKRMYFLGKYAPDESIPGYRRYRISSADMPAEQNGTTCGNRVLCLCKVNYVPMTLDDQICAIDNPYAIKNMVIAIREENAGSFDSARAYEAQALAMLSADKTDEDTGQTFFLSVRNECSYEGIDR